MWVTENKISPLTSVRNGLLLCSMQLCTLDVKNTLSLISRFALFFTPQNLFSAFGEAVCP
jgi:hypothetical protein